MTEINWKQELLDSQHFNQKERKLLKNAPKSLAQIWHVGALYARWKKLKGYREPLTYNCQSSFLEWEHRLANKDFYVITKDDMIYPDW